MKGKEKNEKKNQIAKIPKILMLINDKIEKQRNHFLPCSGHGKKKHYIPLP